MKRTRLAVFADIHGNLPALEAALEEIKAEAVDGILIAGDMVAGPNPQAVIDRLRELGGLMIRGNNENYILRFLSGEAPEWWYTSQQWAFTHWNYRQLDAETLEFIRALPEQRVIHLSGTDVIRVVHGSPRNIAELVYPDKDISLLDIALAQTTEPVLIFGHTHLSWQLQRCGRLAFNPGSLSGQFNGKPCGGYALLTWEGGQWQAELRELPYDIDLIHKSFRESGLLDEGGAVARYFLRDLETGTNSLPRFVEYAWEMTRKAGLEEAPFVPDHIWAQADRLFASELSRGNILL
jgi:putative phosphoesterase